MSPPPADPSSLLDRVRFVLGRIAAGPADPAELDDAELGDWWADEALHLADLVGALDAALSAGAQVPLPWRPPHAAPSLPADS